ncbi:OsmC family protein [Photobacterium kasasachensis]|uniref:OsmC family protein n=1 Tax=Photobacterium kasasachensis TaxID=2910240 RepID=UPI003D1379F1
MSFSVQIDWQQSEQSDQDFSRDHTIRFGSGQQVEGSSAPEYKGNASLVNPEESLIAALSSCHMLTFLAIAHLKRLPVASYNDTATAELGKNADNRTQVSRIELNPKVVFAEGVTVSDEVLDKIHQKAHANCFIANTLACDVVINKQ